MIKNFLFFYSHFIDILGVFHGALDIDLTNINPVKLFSEIQYTDIFKNKLNIFGQIFGSLEGLKQLFIISCIAIFMTNNIDNID